jgi:osmotically-inducible protein OsmY
MLTAALSVVADPAAQVVDLTNRFHEAGASIDNLRVYEIAGVVIIRGRTEDKARAAAVTDLAKRLGHARVANLIQIITADDVQLARMAERELTLHRSLDGCRFNVSADQGVVRIAGRVHHELQKDVAVQVVRSLDGVRSVNLDLTRF